PDEDGLDMLPRLKKARPDMPVIVMSAQNTLMTAIRANERGAYEYLPKPFDLNEVISVVKRALSEPTPQQTATPQQPDEDDSLPLVGRSPAMQEVYRVLARLIGTDLTVMITGESGTGKELFARALHDFGKRGAYPFIAVHMAAIPRELIESELFGHEKGAFTGATTRSLGRFEQANRGTLFLDEIGDMPLEAQTRLLRVLQEGEFTIVGGRQPIRTDVRIVAATHRDLGVLVEQGLFREDLYYRLNVVPLRLPPLRERTEDVPLLARHFFARIQEEGLPGKTLGGEAVRLLQSYDWPGNVRELENLVRRLSALYTEENIGADIIETELVGNRPMVEAVDDAEADSLGDSVDRHVAQYFAAHKDALPTPGLYGRILREVEQPLLQRTLAATRGNQVRAAEVLGLNRNTLRKKIRELGIQVSRTVR
ncbi:MAG TPA: nitrogen regulation protein NR(I), partial [Alphaproteobacteria bacterium]|nr:nitrogen regulation protein NR(I) [Alphaproteobacteria bacterium]